MNENMLIEVYDINKNIIIIINDGDIWIIRNIYLKNHRETLCN